MALTDKLIDIGNAIRNKTGKTGKLTLAQMPGEILRIPSGDGIDGETWIGDGNTHIWVTLPEGRTSPMIGFKLKGKAIVGWGDGTFADSLNTGASEALTWTPTHHYAKPGTYRITIAPSTSTSRITLTGVSTSNQYAYILRHSTGPVPINISYLSYVQKVEVGSKVIIGPYAFNSCRSLKFIKIHDSITSLGTGALSGCVSLSSITLPSQLASIDASAFNACYGMRYYDFTALGGNIPALASTNVFNPMPNDCEILVDASYAVDWVSATNWSSLSDHIVGV